MDKQTTGTVIAAAKQWWMKVNRKPMRMHWMVLNFLTSSRLNKKLMKGAHKKKMDQRQPLFPGGEHCAGDIHADKPSKAKIL